MALGYNNKILMVNLTTGDSASRSRAEVLPPVSGRHGAGHVLLHARHPQGGGSAGPRQRAGHLHRRGDGCAPSWRPRACANAKSPVTGGIGDAQGGGFFGPAMKFAGWMPWCLRARAKSRFTCSSGWQGGAARAPQGIWGIDHQDYETKLREEISKGVVVCGIGPAGEKLYRYACIINERKHANGRTGMGCVMGSKKPQVHCRDRQKGAV